MYEDKLGKAVCIPEHKSVKQIISYGSKTHRSMPGFLVDAGGPLSQAQVDSLMAYLSEVSKTAKYNQELHDRKLELNRNCQSISRSLSILLRPRIRQN